MKVYDQMKVYSSRLFMMMLRKCAVQYFRLMTVSRILVELHKNEKLHKISHQLEIFYAKSPQMSSTFGMQFNDTPDGRAIIHVIISQLTIDFSTFN